MLVICLSVMHDNINSDNIRVIKSTRTGSIVDRTRRSSNHLWVRQEIILVIFHGTLNQTHKKPSASDSEVTIEF